MLKHLSNVRIETLWKEAPSFTRFVFTISIVLSMLSTYTYDSLISNTKDVIWKFQWWRIFTTTFVDPQGFSLIICLVSLSYMMPAKEKQLSTSYVIADFFIHVFIMQSIAIVVQTIVERVIFYSSCGLWGIWAIYFSRHCYTDNDLNQEIDVFFLPFRIKRKYYPLCCQILLQIVLEFNATLLIGFLLGILENLPQFRKVFIITPSLLKIIDTCFSNYSHQEKFLELSQEARDQIQINNCLY